MLRRVVLHLCVLLLRPTNCRLQCCAMHLCCLYPHTMQDDVSELGRDVIKAVSRLLQSSAATTDATHLEYTPDILAAEVLTTQSRRLHCIEHCSACDIVLCIKPCISVYYAAIAHLLSIHMLCAHVQIVGLRMSGSDLLQQASSQPSSRRSSNSNSKQQQQSQQHQQRQQYDQQEMALEEQHTAVERVSIMQRREQLNSLLTAPRR
jgi:hypothetical protein